MAPFPLQTIERKQPWLLKGGYNHELEVVLVLATDLTSSYFYFLSMEDVVAANTKNNPKMNAPPLTDILSILHFILTGEKLKAGS